jgi:hypothetical protein
MELYTIVETLTIASMKKPPEGGSYLLDPKRNRRD